MGDKIMVFLLLISVPFCLMRTVRIYLWRVSDIPLLLYKLTNVMIAWVRDKERPWKHRSVSRLLVGGDFAKRLFSFYGFFFYADSFPMRCDEKLRFGHDERQTEL